MSYLQYQIEPASIQSDRAVYTRTFDLQQADKSALENATGATFDLVLTNGDVSVDVSDHVTAASASSIQVLIPISEWANWTTKPTTLTGWLIYTPSGGVPTQVAHFEGIELKATASAS